ncbi:MULTISPECIES: hypothetical protein [Eggerthella]|uniref:hypothetical protein n=2 Tax=Eggerthella TaxID=84111 RepID=UPI0012E099BD|nr:MULTISPECIES: hypothetical protein [Eggerthella]MBV4056905.1 hypothetical protein [Eggerthella lenta]MDB1784614.1 hypothetical protein [Eggerthella lenta]MDY3951447.1 hypothetical protein [Eggerthella lenta]
MMITPFSSDRASRPVSADQYENRFCRLQAAANERPITANERSCMEPNEAGQMGVRGRSFRSKKNVPMPRSQSRVSLNAAARTAKSSKDRMALQWWQALQLPRQ